MKNLSNVNLEELVSLAEWITAEMSNKTTSRKLNAQYVQIKNEFERRGELETFFTIERGNRES